MFSRCLHPRLLCAALVLAACTREARPTRDSEAYEEAPKSTSMQTHGPRDARADFYEGNAYAISQGQLWFTWYNCSGCHGNGGGGMGPPLMDAEWRYGGRIEEIYSTIADGRPNGMPSFDDIAQEEQIWQLAAYVRSLSGNVNRVAAPSREDGMRSIPPINNIDPPRAGGERAP